MIDQVNLDVCCLLCPSFHILNEGQTKAAEKISESHHCPIDFFTIEFFSFFRRRFFDHYVLLLLVRD